MNKNFRVELGGVSFEDDNFESFETTIGFKLVNGDEISFSACGDDDRYFDDYALLVTVSPKQLGTEETVEKMIRLLKGGVMGYDGDEYHKIFKRSCSGKKSMKEENYDFIEEIRSKIKTMDDIESIFIIDEGRIPEDDDFEDDYNYRYSHLWRKAFTYNRKTKEYECVIENADCKGLLKESTYFDFDLLDCAVRCRCIYYNVDNYDLNINTDRRAAYFDENDDGTYWFSVKYSNPILEKIITDFHYNYSPKQFEDITNIRDIEEAIPGYDGVRTLDEFTTTLISVLVSFGTGRKGFEDELNKQKAEIIKAFTYIEGTSQESYDKATDICAGYDFGIVNGVYRATFRICNGGW